MTEIIANLFVDVHLSKAKLTLFLNGNCFLIASTVSVSSLQQMMLRVLADSYTNSRHNALYELCGSRFDIMIPGMWAETNPDMW